MDLIRVTFPVHRRVQHVPQSTRAGSGFGFSCCSGSPSCSRLVLVARRVCSRHHDGYARTTIHSAGCCLAAPGREWIRDAGEDTHLPGISLGETADEEPMTVDLQ